MRIFKSHPLLKIVNSYLIDSPQPSNLSYMWNFGSLLAFSLGIQIITGVTLAMHYNPSVMEAFNSVEHIMRDVNNGWLIRYLHSNTASAFFFIVYLHIGRGLYYGSYRAPRTLVWTIGTVIFILMMATAFLGFLTIAQNDFNLFTTITIITIITITIIIITTKYHLPIRAKKYKVSPRVNKFSKYINTFESKRCFSTSRKNPYCQFSEILSEFIESKDLNPIYTYENIGEDSTKKKILVDTKGLSGIYLILNKSTLDYYIGSAATDRFYKRFSNHLINFHGSKVVKNAVKRYKLSSFAFLVLELFPDIVTKENNKKLLDMEDFYLKSLLPDYNILTEAGSSFGYKHTEITRIKMKANFSEQRKVFIGNLNKGQNFSSETIDLMKEKALNRNKPLYTQQGITNMKKASKPILVKNLDRTVYGEFTSIVETAKILNCSEKTVSRALKSPKKMLKRRWIVNYVY